MAESLNPDRPFEVRPGVFVETVSIEPESWETSKMLLCTIQQHPSPRTRFTVRVNDEHRAFNTFAELKHWLLTTQR